MVYKVKVKLMWVDKYAQTRIACHSLVMCSRGIRIRIRQVLHSTHIHPWIMTDSPVDGAILTH